MNRTDAILCAVFAYCVVMLALTADLWRQWDRTDAENMDRAICMVMRCK